MTVQLLNDRVYSRREVERWLAETAQVKPRSRAWNKALTSASGTIVGEDTYLFVPVSETHYRVSRANAEEVAEIFKVLDGVTGLRRLKRVRYICAALLAAGVVLLIGVGLFHP